MAGTATLTTNSFPGAPMQIYSMTGVSGTSFTVTHNMGYTPALVLYVTQGTTAAAYSYTANTTQATITFSATPSGNLATLFLG